MDGSSQRSAVPGLCCSDAQVRPSPCFSPLSIGEGWSAGRRPGSLAIGSLRPALRSAGLHAELPGPKCWREWGSRDARASCEEARAPLGAPSRHALSAAAPCSVLRHRDRRRPRTSKAWRCYRDGKRKEGLFELECELAGERGIAQSDQYAPLSFRGASVSERARNPEPRTEFFSGFRGRRKAPSPE